jgi:aminopeptidase N
MDWFFDEWVYKMGHPVFRVTQDYDAAKKELTLKVRQEQRPDPESQYPQVGLFQTPVDIQIGTASSTRVERVQIEAKEEQTFKFKVDSEPLLVGFDYGGTLIKELMFVKTTGQLLYQLDHDQDVLGRIWALSQLAMRMKDEKTSAADRDSIAKGLGGAATTDKFWATRFEAVAALEGSRETKDALLAATKDADARVRARAVTSLAATKDPSLAETYNSLTADRSYAVIRAAAVALGQTKSSMAYDTLTKLIDFPSWRDTIRASGLNGLAALGDQRALELGFKYQAAPNPQSVRSAALNLLGATGKGDPRTFDTLNDTLKQAFARRNFGLMNSAAEALIALGDERGLAAFQDLGKKPGNSPQLASAFSSYEARLKAKLVQSKPSS